MKVQSDVRLQNNPGRIDPLDVLPLFLKLDGKRALVVGDGPGAIWKMELLLQAGAHVSAVCAKPTRQVFELLSGNWPGKMELQCCHWREVSFDGATIIIGDVEDCEAKEFYAKGRMSGAFVNVIDKPAFCDFQFGSIVNRSPVVIGISTGGAAPVLAQLVRTIIEQALPEALRSLARKAKELRPKINARLPSIDQRRRYWSAFFERLQGGAMAESDRPHRIRCSEVQFLTLRDLSALRKAEHVFLYPGASEDIAKLARREAQRHMLTCYAVNTVLPPASVVLGTHSGFSDE